jgi:acyl carrier protein
MNKLNKIIANVFQMNADEIADDISMEDIDRWDSLTHMKLVVSLEEKYNLEFSAEQIIAMKNIRTIKKIISEKAAV